MINQRRSQRQPDRQNQDHHSGGDARSIFQIQPGGGIRNHPGGDDLYHYFSPHGAEQLTGEQRTRIKLHVVSCNACAEIGKTIEGEDEALAALLASPETPEDRANTERSIAMFHAMVEGLKAEEERMSKPEHTDNKRNLWLTDPTESLRLTEEMANAIPALAEAVRAREIPKALAIVAKNINYLETLPLLQPGAMHLLAYCAWAIDYTEGYFDQVREGVARFREAPRKELTLQDLSLFNLSEGLIKFHQEQYGESEEFFRLAQDDADRAEDSELMTIVRYYRGRSLWKMRRYDEALGYIRDAICRDLVSRNQPRVAAMELVEGWLLFLKGEIGAAQQVLTRARARLGANSKAWVDLGNILSFQGRLYREAGPEHYFDALDCFAEAIRLYRKHDDPSHRNIARTHLNAALVYRILARDLADKRVPFERRARVEADVASLRRQAVQEIEQAQTIYELARSRHSSERSRLHSLLALLYFDDCKFEEAAKEAEASFTYASETGSNVGMANARIIQSKLALDGGLNGFVDVTSALSLAQEAVGYAEQTENRRARARAHIRLGHALLELPDKDLAGARRSLKAAQDRLVAEDRDYIRKALTHLEEMIDAATRSTHHDSSPVYSMTVGQLKEDISLGFSLSEINEEQEERIARFVFVELCDQNVTRAAQSLKTSARKIRKAISVFALTEAALNSLAQAGVGSQVLDRLARIKDREVEGQSTFVRLLRETLKADLTDRIQSIILGHVKQHR